MYSKARIAGRPVHPMLVGVPIALFLGTIALELAYIGTQDILYYRAAMMANVAGVIAALVAIVPGTIDVRPGASRTRSVARQHAMFNGLTVGLFALSAFVLYATWTTRTIVDGAYALDAAIPLAVSVVGFVSMVIAGALGWTAVKTQDLATLPAPARAAREPELDDLLADLRGAPAAQQYGRPAHITLH